MSYHGCLSFWLSELVMIIRDAFQAGKPDESRLMRIHIMNTEIKIQGDTSVPIGMALSEGMPSSQSRI